jgi:Putative addiction module component
MPKPFEEVTRDAIQLPRQQRLALAGVLLELEDASGDSDADAAWEEEILARIHAIDNGMAVGISYEEVMREAQKRLAPWKSRFFEKLETSFSMPFPTTKQLGQVWDSDSKDAVEKTSMTMSIPPEALRRARLALSKHAECFWTRRSGAPLVDRNDIELIIRRLRENGGSAAWQTAREIEACL